MAVGRCGEANFFWIMELQVGDPMGHAAPLPDGRSKGRMTRVTSLEWCFLVLRTRNVRCDTCTQSIYGNKGDMALICRIVALDESHAYEGEG